MKPLTAREKAFVDAFMGPARGNATKAALTAGYSKKNARHQASRLLTKANIAGAVARYEKKRETRSIANATERDEIFSSILRDEEADLHARISAGKELNKCSGRHSMKHVLDVTKNLADLVAESRK
jgi:phage terminase small subunit